MEDVKSYLAKNPTGMNIEVGFGKRNMLHRAIWRNNLEVVQFLVEEKKMNINQLSGDKEHSLGLVVSNEMFEYLLTIKPQCIHRDPIGFTILHHLASNGVLKGVKYMVEVQKANIEDASNNATSTPLMCAIKENKWVVVEYLLQKGANINTEGWGSNPLYEAVKNNNTEMVAILLRYKAQKYIEVSPNNEANDKPLHKAIVANNFAIVKLLVENRADLSKEDYVAFAKSYSLTDKSIIEYLQNKSKK